MSTLHEKYVSPFQTRYASEAMQTLLGDQSRCGTWRRLWLALAESQQELGLEITDEQLQQMREHLDDIDFQAVARYEREFRHDVMAHIHAFGDVAPAARPIIHLGATSQFVNCNTDAILTRRALDLLAGKLAAVIDALGTFAEKWKSEPALAFTHFQPAQPTTVGKRATLWAQDFAMDLADVEYRRDGLEFRSVKGTTGTQASFLALFDGDHDKVLQLERRVAERMDFERVIPVTGQTISRKVDAQVAQVLGGIGATVHRVCNDIRLLAHRKELEEPFGAKQIGSSAMAYKRNPMRSERATAIARFLMDVSVSPLHTAAEQWLERTLDDSANKRLAMNESFLAADSVLEILLNVASGLVVYPKVIAANLQAELPFMATENILMAAVRAGGDRQLLHERIRVHSQDAARQVKEQGLANDLIERLKGDEAFAGVDIDALMDPSQFVGRAPQQTERFLTDVVQPIRDRYADRLGGSAELKV